MKRNYKKLKKMKQLLGALLIVTVGSGILLATTMYLGEKKKNDMTYVEKDHNEEDNILGSSDDENEDTELLANHDANDVKNEEGEEINNNDLNNTMNDRGEELGNYKDNNAINDNIGQTDNHDKSNVTNDKTEQTEIIEQNEKNILNEENEKLSQVVPPDAATPAMIIDTGKMGEGKVEQYFNQSEITSELFDRIYGVSYKTDCKVPKEDLVYIKLLHYGFDDKVHVGEMIVNKKIADDVLEIFKELYDVKYPIDKMLLVDEYNADDNASMADNNSSSFNYRVVDGTTKLSKHSQGLAIDINPLYNPYVRTRNGKLEVLPEEGKNYTDRSQDCPYFIMKNDVCYNAFIKKGFSWGGEWNSSKDYQHFDITLE